MLKPVTAKDIRGAALKLRTGTSDIEGMGPRHIALLSEDALEVLAGMMWISEFGRCYPRIMEQVVVKLLAKKDGGSRPIMLFRSVFRVNCKARKGMVTKWEIEVASGKAFNNAPGRRIGDSIYRAAIRHALPWLRGRKEIQKGTTTFSNFCLILRKLLIGLAGREFGPRNEE